MHHLFTLIVQLSLTGFYTALLCGETRSLLWTRTSVTVQHGVQCLEEEPRLLSHITAMGYNSKKEQFILLSSISNYHWFEWPSLRSSKMTKHQCVSYAEHVLVDTQDDEGKLSHKYIPLSPRNRLMYVLSVEDTRQAGYMVLKV